MILRFGRSGSHVKVIFNAEAVVHGTTPTQLFSCVFLNFQEHLFNRTLLVTASVNKMSNFYHARFDRLFFSCIMLDFLQKNPVNFANIVHNKEGVLGNYRGLIDGTVSACCITDENQGLFYTMDTYVYMYF